MRTREERHPPRGIYCFASDTDAPPSNSVGSPRRMRRATVWGAVVVVRGVDDGR